MRMCVRVILAFCTLCLLHCASRVVHSAQEAGVVINEFMASNSGSVSDEWGDYDDWIELYNGGADAVDLAGHSLTDNPGNPFKWRFPVGHSALTTIPAGGYLLVWADGEAAEGPLHAGFKLSADGESIALHDAQGSLLDSVRFGVQSANVSYGRFPDGGDLWRFFVVPTPGASNRVDAGDIVISEFMYHPRHAEPGPEDTRLEWIELFNAGASPVDLAGWRFSDGVAYTFSDVVIEPGERLVVAADVNAFRAGYPDVTNVAGGWTGSLSNSGERIALSNAGDVMVDVVRYADQGDWAVRELGPVDLSHRGWQWSDEADGGGKSLELVCAAAPNEFGQNWAASLLAGGTPGSGNSVAADDIAPMILEVRHSPLVPGPDDPVSVTARVIDESAGRVTILLRYRVDQSAYAGINVYPQASADDFTAVQMSDDGIHADGTASDGVYGAWIPPHADGTTIEFYVEAVDDAGWVRTWPAPSRVDDEWRQVTNALYHVDAPFEPGTYGQIAGQPLYYIVMTEMERGRLAYIGSHSTVDGPDAQMNATFISVEGTDTELRYRANVRNRGHGTRRSPPNNYHVNFPHDSPWNGVGAINFNARYTHVQILGSEIFRMAGLVAADAAAVQVRINGANLAYPGTPMYGVYARIEVFDEDFAERHFPDDPDGNLYTCFRTGSGPEAELRYEGVDPNAYRDRYFKANHAARDDWSDLIHLVDVLNNAPEDVYLEQVGKVIDITQWLRYIALDSLLLNYETGLNMGMGDDYYMYRGVIDPRFVLIPHDLDTILDQGTPHGSIDQSIFSVVTGVAGRNGVDGLKRLFNHPEIVPLYYGQLLDLMGTVLSPEQFDPLVDQVLGDWVPPQVLDAIEEFVVRRNAAVLAQIPRALTISSLLPVRDGYPYTTVPTYALFGTADVVETRSVLVDGTPAAWSPREGTWQSGEASGRADSCVAAGSEWKYLDDGSDQGTAWQSPAFNDTAWRSGRAELGYGDGGEATVVDSGPSGNRFITTYFRHTFTVTDISKYSLLRVQLLADDGAVVYLNGVEAWRNGMPAGTIGYTTRASASLGGQEESTFVEQELPVNLLREGTNVLAVEVHQNSPSSSDISFDLALEAVRQSEGTGQLLPGINRIVVQTFDGRDGAGNKLDEGYIDIWYDNGGSAGISGALSSDAFLAPAVRPWRVMDTATVTGVATYALFGAADVVSVLDEGSVGIQYDGGGSEISGVLSSDTVLASAAGPWYVTNTVTVPAGVTLTIEPGATLFFHPDMGMTVNGRLIAEGAPDRRITLTKVPTTDSWAGLRFLNTKQESRLVYVHMEYSDAGSQAIHADHADVYMDHVVWANHMGQYLTFDDSSIVLKNSVLPSIRGDELVHFWGFPSDGHALFEGNWFGTTSGYNDIIDFTGGQRPGPIARFINNTFSGASDDAIDLDAADAHVEGNIFMHMHAESTGSGSLSHAVSTGTEYGQYSEVTAVRNLFYDVDHAFLSKDDGFITAVNNTVVHATRAAVNMYEARSGQWQGRGFYGDGNIFHDVAHVFANPDWAGHPTAITMNNSIFPIIVGDPVVWEGAGNLGGIDPQLVEEVNITDPLLDMQLLASSPAIGAGPNGRDMGGIVPPGASISGEPALVTWKDCATLTVGGPDLFAYKYRVNDGPWSEPVVRPDALLPADPKPLPPIELTGLQNMLPYTVSVLGMDSAGVWQSEDSPTVSRTWIVDPSYYRLVINEVLAANVSAVEHEGTFPDMVELFYDGPTAMSLSGMSLSNDPLQPTRFVFPAEVMMQPGEYLVLFADNEASTSGLHLGFGLDAGGGSVSLYDKSGTLVDSVEFGVQLPGLSIGRVGGDGLWRLTVPTFGQANVSHPLGDPRSLRINEWLAGEQVLFGSDFIELYNPHPLPVDLGGFCLTDSPETEPDRHRIGPLTFIAGQGYFVVAADGQTGSGHLEFRLSSDGGRIALFDAAFNGIDQVVFGPQTSDASQGRSPDGSGRFDFFTPPTPGTPNPQPPEATITPIVLLGEDAPKRAVVPDSADHVGDAWKSDVDFDDSSWLSASGAPGGVGYERSSGYESLIGLDVEAPMYNRATTCYVRIPFHNTVETQYLASLQLSVRYDDGFVAWLNGTEVGRANFTGAPQWNSSAAANHDADGDAFDVVLDLSGRIDLIRPGDNLLAIQALNVSRTSSDLVISVTLTGAVVETQ